MLPAAAALLVYAYQRVGRARILNLLVFVRAPFNFPGPGDRVFGGSLQLTAALLVDTCERDGSVGAMHRFLFALPPLNFHGARGRGVVGLGESLPSAAGLL